jgi:hypothetical protein
MSVDVLRRPVALQDVPYRAGQGVQARDLADQQSHRSGEPLSKATLYATVTALKRFFIWLAGQPGYKSRISYSDAEYFNLSAK